MKPCRSYLIWWLQLLVQLAVLINSWQLDNWQLDTNISPKNTAFKIVGISFMEMINYKKEKL